MSERVNLEEFRVRRSQVPALFDGQLAADADRLADEVEQLRIENGQLRDELASARTWIARSSPDYEAVIAWVREQDR